MKTLIFIFSIYSLILAKYDCNDCKQSYDECVERANNAANNGRVPHYCNPNICDEICEEEYKEQNGIKTNAEKYADERFNAESNLYDSHQQFVNSLNDHQSLIYSQIKSIFQNYYNLMRNECTQQNLIYEQYGMNVDFRIKLCLLQKCRALTYNESKSTFIYMMNQLKIDESDWNIANITLNYLIGQLGSTMY